MKVRSLVAGCGALLLLVVAGCGGGTAAAAAPAATPTVPVSVAHAERRDVPALVRAVGTVESPASVVLKPRIAGEVVDVPLQDGQDVKAGDLLVVLDRRPFEAALHAAEAALARDTATAEDAARNAASWGSLTDKRAVSQRTLEQAQATATAAAATVQVDQATVEAARLALSYCEIRAPFDGRTGRLLVRKGSSVKENETELVSLQQITPIRVAFAVPESRLPEIQARRAEGPLDVEVTPAGGAVAHGVLDFIDNAVDSTTGTILLRANLENAARTLWPGQLVDVALTVALDKGAVIVPARAVQPGQNGDYVFVVGADGAVEQRVVKVRSTDRNEAVIADGLKGDETVVTDGQLRLVPGTHVAPK